MGAPRALSRWRALLAGAILTAGGVLAYSNGFSGPFVFDDITSIPQNPNTRSLWPIWRALWAPRETTASGRPMLSLSLAVNYRISGLDVWSYHAVNLAIHILAGLTLFGVVRRTLLSDRLKERFGAYSTVLALICALVWLVHPLQTQAVTYIVQRAESLMGLFYLLTVYCSIRSLGSRRSGLWQAAAMVSCAAGMGTKEAMVTAPVMVVLYDRIFSFGSFKQAVRRRWRLYAGLAVTWAILAALVAAGPRGESAGLGLRTITPLDYAKTQCNVILHYLRLTFWPDRLVLDYDWPVARSFGDFAPSGVVLLGLLAAVAVALRYRPALGFLGAWFFLILGPTSSFVPIADVAFEQRMYLPLAATIVGVVLAAREAGRRLIGRRAAAAVVGYLLAACVVVGLGLLTFRRNTDYRSNISIWQDTVNKAGHSARAYHGLGNAYAGLRDYTQAIASYSKAIELDPKYPPPYEGRAGIYASQGDYRQAVRDYTAAIRLYPKGASAYAGRGAVHSKNGSYGDAMLDYTKALELDPSLALTYVGLGILRLREGDYDKAIADFDTAIRLNPEFAQAYGNRAIAYIGKGQHDEALRDSFKAVELYPDYASARFGLASLLLVQGRAPEAVNHYRQGLRVKPNSPEAANDLAWVLATHASVAVRNGPEAVKLAERACELSEYKTANVLDTLAAAYGETGRFDEAVQTAQKALDLATATGQGQLAAEIRSRLDLYRAKQPYREAFSISSAGTRQPSTASLAQ